MVSNVAGIGVDIEDISRFRDRPFDANRHFYEKIFTEQEITYCLLKKDPYPSFAVRFCAKEACVKAAGTPITNYRDIEIVTDDNKSVVVWLGERYLLSMSHDRDKAIAFVVMKKASV